MGAGKQWAFFLYDEQNRMIASGLYDKDATRDAMASFVKNLNNGVSFYLSIYRK